MFDESHIEIINTFEMHLSQGDLFTGKKYVDKICYKVQNIVRRDNDSMNKQMKAFCKNFILWDRIEEKHSSLKGVWLRSASRNSNMC